MSDAPAVEVKAASDDAWFEAHLEIDGDKLLAKVPHMDDESETIAKEEVKSRIRFPANQVHDKECSQVKEGDELCALNNTTMFSRYYDATVLKVERHGHVQKLGHEVCMCEFLVKWLSGPDKGETSVVGCECLCKIDATPIDSHPVVSKYLS